MKRQYSTNIVFTLEVFPTKRQICPNINFAFIGLTFPKYFFPIMVNCDHLKIGTIFHTYQYITGSVLSQDIAILPLYHDFS